MSVFSMLEMEGVRPDKLVGRELESELSRARRPETRWWKELSRHDASTCNHQLIRLWSNLKVLRIYKLSICRYSAVFVDI